MVFFYSQWGVCAHMCLFFYRIRYVMQKNIVIFLILHIFIWRLYWCWIHMRSFRKAFTSCAFLNYVCVQKNAFFGWWLNGKKKKKYAGYIQLQIPVPGQYFILWLNQFYFSIFCLSIWALRCLCSFHPEFTAYAQGFLLPSQVGFPNQTCW